MTPLSDSEARTVQRFENAEPAPESWGGGLRTHELKTWPEPFQAVLDGAKPYEVRNNDRGFCVGDVLVLREWDPESRTYTGRESTQRVTHVLAGGFGLRDGYVALGLERPVVAALRAKADAADRVEAVAKELESFTVYPLTPWQLARRLRCALNGADPC